MIDIIISVNDNCGALEKTLCSIALQNIKNKLNVFILNNSSENYKKICKKFAKFLNIFELKNKENINEKQYGINNSNSNYILFMKSGDLFYDSYSLNNLYNKINNDKLDVVISKVYEENENHVYHVKKELTNNLNGKIFKRKFLSNNNIKFLDNNYKNEIIFLYMIKLLTTNVNALNNITYISQYKKVNNDYKNISNNLCKLVDFINNNTKSKTESIFYDLFIQIYYDFINDIYDINEIKTYIKPFYLKIKDSFSNLSEFEKTNIYNKYSTKIIPNITLNEFINLIII